MKPKILTKSSVSQTAIPAGTYPARCGGYVTVFEVSQSTCKAESETNGIRGMNLRDTVTVAADGSMRSQLLGVVTLVELKAGG